MTDPKRLYEGFSDFGRGSNIILRITRLNIFLLMNHKAVVLGICIYFLYSIDKRLLFQNKVLADLGWGFGFVKC